MPKASIAGKSFAYTSPSAAGRLHDFRAARFAVLDRDPLHDRFDATNLPAFGDIEPNDSFAEASAMPPDLKIEGTVGQFTDGDWFKLPKVEKDTGVSIVATGEFEVALTDGKPTSFPHSCPNRSIIASGDKGDPVKGTVPAGATAAIRVIGRGAYTLAVTMDDRATVRDRRRTAFSCAPAKKSGEPSTAGNLPDQETRHQVR